VAGEADIVASTGQCSTATELITAVTDIIKKRNFVIMLGKAEGDYKNRKDSAKSGRVGSYGDLLDVLQLFALTVPFISTITYLTTYIFTMTTSA